MNRDNVVRMPAGDQAAPDPAAGPTNLVAAVLTSAEFDLFARLGRERRVVAGEVLFRRGDPGTTMYVVASGEVELDFGDDLLAKRLGPCEFFGELGLLIGDHARSADATVTMDGALLELSNSEFERLVDRDPGLVSYFLRRAIMRVVANEQGLIRRLRRRNHDLQAALDHLHATTTQLNQTEEMVRTDDLTGLYNRRGLNLHLQESRAIGMPEALGLILVDCDRFKQVNDDHGHLVGDRVLQSVASILRAVSGPDDIACRLGGDEFCLLVTAASKDEVMRFAEYIVRTARQLMELSEDHHSAPTICPLSVGAALVDPQLDWNDWYALADGALYRAKRLGGGRVEWQEPAAATA